MVTDASQKQDFSAEKIIIFEISRKQLTQRLRLPERSHGDTSSTLGYSHMTVCESLKVIAQAESP